MINKILLSLAVLSLIMACSQKEPQTLEVNTDKHPTYNVVCLNGIKYYQSTYVLAPVYDRQTNKVATCGAPDNIVQCFITTNGVQREVSCERDI